MLSEAEFREFHRPVGGVPLYSLLGKWALLVVGIYLLSLGGVWLGVGILVLLRQQLALSVMMHEGVHNLLAKNKTMNDFVGTFFCSGPILSHFHAYRMLHLQHHRFTLDPEKDPGQYLLHSDRCIKTLILDVLKDLSGYTYLTLGSKVKLRKLQKKQILMNIAGQIAGLTLIWSIFGLFGIENYFFYSWVIPLVTVHQVILRVRALMEHGGLSHNKKAALCTRTVKGGFITSLVAPYNINYHIEHHLYPNVSGSRLPKLATLISEKENSFRVDRNYGEAFVSIYK